MTNSSPGRHHRQRRSHRFCVLGEIRLLQEGVHVQVVPHTANKAIARPIGDGTNILHKLPLLLLLLLCHGAFSAALMTRRDRKCIDGRTRADLGDGRLGLPVTISAEIVARS